jgi:type IV secretion system protein VirB1
MLPPMDMIHQCAPNVAPETVQAIIRVESGGNPYAVGVNGSIRQKPHPKNSHEAVYWANYYMHRGYSVDLGLMQINSGNLRGLGLTLNQVFDPCTNLKAGSRILSRGYAGAAKRYGPGQTALKAALSAYNTGNYERGFHNGYVAKYFNGNGVTVTVKAKAPERLLASANLKRKVSTSMKVDATLPEDTLTDTPYTSETTIYIQPQALDNIISPWE